LHTAYYVIIFLQFLQNCQMMQWSYRVHFAKIALTLCMAATCDASHFFPMLMVRSCDSSHHARYLTCWMTWNLQECEF
jgi:hypothetical protein